MKKDMIENELDLDRNVTVDPKDWEVTDEIIEKIRRKEMMQEILHDESLSEKEKFDKLKEKGLGMNSLSELRRFARQLK